MPGRTIRLFLVDGIANGVLIAEVGNWTGKVLVAPRTQLPEPAKRPEVKRTGVYILIGDDPEESPKERIYIGESEDVLTRLTQHNNDQSKEFWTRTVIISSKDENLTKAHIRYLESRLIRLAVEAGRANLTNSTNPDKVPLPEADVSDMDTFLEYIQLVLPVIGFAFAQPVPTAKTLTTSTVLSGIQDISPVFQMKAIGIHAQAQEINGEFVVLAGSHANKTATASLHGANLQRRDQLIKDRKLVDNGHNGALVFAEDVAFTSPSAAASIVAGSPANGRVYWKTSQGGQTYADWQTAQISQATNQSQIDETVH